MLANLVSSSPCGLCITDARAPGGDDPIVFVNRAFEAQTGYGAAECEGRNCRFLQSPFGSGRAPSFASGSIRKAVAAGTRRTVRILNYKKDGTPVWNDLSVVPLRNVSGAVTHFVGMQTFTPIGDLVTAAGQGGLTQGAQQQGEGGQQQQQPQQQGEGGLSAALRRLKSAGLAAKSQSCCDLSGMASGGGRPLRAL
uniref:Putative LOV domain-containing protein n=1 Tax=Picochlorum atomus TaxID=133490 RepID=A0A126WZA1_PICAT|nr:putative LOV domain-containing protein [Picochlorum atomus]